jgi:superfamily II DNA or RNA helicase
MTGLLPIYASLFKGREDVFAFRREKDGKGSYFTAYDLDWEAYRIHKSKGGSFETFTNKSLIPLTTHQLLKHLEGKQTIGIYPLLADNTSWFIAADFDKAKWMDDCRSFLSICREFDLPAYLERSRSGKGGHVWIFFAASYPAIRSRAIIKHLLKSAGLDKSSPKTSSFDRLFPNQNSHSGKELGNLIALPLQKESMEKGNACFIDPVTSLPFDDQFVFLQGINRVTIAKLDELFSNIAISDDTIEDMEPEMAFSGGELHIKLDTEIVLNRRQVGVDLMKFLRSELNFLNADYLIRKKMGKGTYGVGYSFNVLEEDGNKISFPRGFARQLVLYCIKHNVPYRLIDNRKKLTPIIFNSKINLYDYQQAALEVTEKKELGVIVAPPGSGKTVIGLSIIAKKKQPALIIVHRKHLFDQWIERIQSFLGIPEHRIGKISDGRHSVGLEITVAMIQSLATIESANDLFKAFGTVIVDECHHMPSTTFKDTIKNLYTYYLYGLTATPIRKNNDEKLIFINIGDIIHEVKFQQESSQYTKAISINIRDTGLVIPFDIKTDKPETLYQILINDSARNQLIIDDISQEVTAGKRVLVLTERKAHIDTLYQYLKGKYETITLSGEDKDSAKRIKLKQINEGEYQILIATGQFVGEGSDINTLDSLVLAFPFAFEGKLIQYIGRVQRNISTPVIYDYRDAHIDYLDKLFKQRNKYYRKLAGAGEIRKYKELYLIFEGERLFIDIKAHPLPVFCLDLPVKIVGFKKDIVWRVRILKHDEESNELLSEVLDYSAEYLPPDKAMQLDLNLLSIEKIRFRSIDTAGLLNSVILKSLVPAIPKADSVQGFSGAKVESRISKSMKVPFSKIQFLYGSVVFPIYIEELGHEVSFEIANPDMRPEFEAIKNYFIKVLKKKLIVADIEILYDRNQILSTSASSEDITKIDNTFIETVRFQFIKKEIFKPGEGGIFSHEQLLKGANGDVNKIFSSEQDLIADILNMKKYRHYQQVKYLAGQHEATILKIRFILKPFSFLFLLSGNKFYHIVWETLDSEEATYVWHAHKSKEGLRAKIGEIEDILIAIRDSGKMDYLQGDHADFSRVVHDYSDSKKGFVLWKSQLEERIT